MNLRIRLNRFAGKLLMFNGICLYISWIRFMDLSGSTIMLLLASTSFSIGAVIHELELGEDDD